MGQVFVPAIKEIILTAVDRLIARNADGGISDNAAHIVLLGENAGQNLGDVDHVYVIGSDSLKGGLANNVQEGTTVYGANIFSALVNSTPASLDGPLVAIGFNIAPLVTQRAGSSVLVGDAIARIAPSLISDLDGSVVIGNEAIEYQKTLAANGGTLSRRSVIIGWRAARGASAVWADGSGTSLNENVLIGAQVAENCGAASAAPGTIFESNVIIGTRACINATNAAGLSSQLNVAIGYEVGNNNHRSGTRNVWLGASIVTPGLDSSEDVIIGALANGAHTAGGAFGNNVVIGARANISGLDGRCIFLGSGANSQATIGAGSDFFLVETVNPTTAVRRNLVYGNMGTLTGAVVTACGIAFGLSGAANRDLPGMNIVKIIDGNRDAGLTAPVGGGYFYSNAGNVHWVSSGNVDYDLTNGGVGIFTVATLPAAPPAGTRAFVNDALAPAFGAAVAGGGAVFIPVFFNGAAWIVG